MGFIFIMKKKPLIKRQVPVSRGEIIMFKVHMKLNSNFVGSHSGSRSTRHLEISENKLVGYLHVGTDVDRRRSS